MTPSVPDETRDLHQELLAQLRDLVPSAFLDGELDRDALLGALGLDGDSKPAFSFTWPGIERARQDARVPTTATLVPDEDASLRWSDARDVLIEGDNLQVLKLLKNGYSRAVKLIYIDPPYNTGDTFTYNDDFAVPERQYLEETGQVDDQGNATTSRIETGGRKHAPWLTMMFPRLALARHLLRRDGVILVSIDDNEVHHLRLLLDAVFGGENFVGNFIWNGGRKNDARQISVGHDYVVAYARDHTYLREQDARWRERKAGLDEIYGKVKELRAVHGTDYEAATAALQAWYNSLPDEAPAKAHKHYRVIDARGVYFASDLRSPNPRANLVYTFRGHEPHANGWAYGREKMEAFADDDRIVYPKKEGGRLQLKSYLHEHEEWAPASVFYKDRRAASKALDVGGHDVVDSGRGQ
ncbi:site-specific DNA-methyltransferase [Micrococcus luteus]|uniref:site-specific DNA-methyltransferase n=1 Tax=Micrococcus luteus TaxID=1270 RepID=UPI00382A8270